MLAANVLLALCHGVGARALESSVAQGNMDSCSSGSGSTCSHVLLQHSSSSRKIVMNLTAAESKGAEVCDESSWPDKDHGRVCGECKVLVDKFSSKYHTCDGYCAAVGRQCVGAWEEQNDDCAVAYDMTCGQSISSSDAICECGAQVAGGGSCYGEMQEVAEVEGNGIGVPKIVTQSVEDCKRVCDENNDCKSFSFCPKFNGCWLKDQVLSGSEPQRSFEDCKTVYKTPCNDVPDDEPETPTQQPTSSDSVRVVSYNLFWWNAFDQNAWKSNHITANIRDTLQADVLGLQECDSSSLIAERTGYSSASPFQGAQGIMVKSEAIQVGPSGSRDIEATGKWGPRYVTWARMTHKQTGWTFWHFNTHWCVHTGNGRTCNSNTRYEGARNMLSIIQEVAGDAPVVITGDFNANMAERGPRHFLQNGFDLAVTHWVDAVFYSKAHWQVVSISTGDTAHSDHNPVIANLRLVSAGR